MNMLQLQLRMLILAGWVNLSRQDVIEYLREENQVLREQLGERRLLRSAASSGDRGFKLASWQVREHAIMSRHPGGIQLDSGQVRRKMRTDAGPAGCAALPRRRPGRDFCWIPVGWEVVVDTFRGKLATQGESALGLEQERRLREHC